MLTGWYCGVSMLAFAAGLAGVALPAGAQSPDVVARGKYLATAGDCVACHTAAGGAEYAGGYVMNTPFGSIVSPNLTPDKETGIGNWSDDQFYRAMHNGLDDEGKNLYPAFPYPWYTRVTRDDVLAIKAYLFSLPPVHAQRAPNHLMFPMSVRSSVLAWNELNFHPGEFKPDPSKSDQVNRGAYLVEGLGHCGDCHTPKGVSQGPVASQKFAGGQIDNWYAPNISSDVREGIGGWSETELATYLKTGSSPGRGVVLGPMAQTVHDSLSKMTDDDLGAMAAYLKQTPAKQSFTPETPVSAEQDRPGAVTYLNYCASCHQPDGKGIADRVPNLAGNGAVASKGPETTIRAVLGGLAANGSYAPMPGFAGTLSNDQIAEVVNFVRSSWGNGAPANATGSIVAGLADSTRTMMAGTAACTAMGDSAADKAVQDSATGIPSLLKSVTGETMLPVIDQILSKVKASVNGASQADIVNSLTAAYCPVATASGDREAARRSLDRFSGLVYTQLVSSNKL